MRQFMSYEIPSTLHSGLHVFVETRELEFTSAGALLDKFHNECEPDEPLTAKPLAMVLNPRTNGMPVFSESNVWLVLYRCDFWVTVYKNYRQTSGPHQVKLKYKSYQTGNRYWIASLQITDVMFFDEARMKEELLKCALAHDYFCSDKSRKDKIPI